MKPSPFFWLALVNALGLFQFSAAAQQISVDTSAFEEKFPEEKYLFYLTGFERVLDELDLTADQQTKMTTVREKIGAKHKQHKARIDELKGKGDIEKQKQAVEDLLKRFHTEISDELAQVKDILSDEQSTRIRQIAFQYFFFTKNRTNHAVDRRRLLLDRTIANGLQISSMQNDVIVHAYKTLELELKRIDSDDTDKHLKLLADTHKTILGILNEEQRRVVNDIIGPPAQALHYPTSN